MDKIEILEVTPADLIQLQKISRQTFSETFSAENREEDMKLYFEKELSAEKLKSELDEKDSQFYFALSRGGVVGYLKLNTGQAQTEIRDSNALEIERIYVLKEFLGKKVGQVLYEKAIEVARQKKFEYVWLGVWEENHRAIHFYKKQGFVCFDKHVFKLGNDEQTDIMMKLYIHEQ